MSNTTPSNIPANWYPDPENPAQWRYWDGGAWTDHVQGAASNSTPDAFVAGGGSGQVAAAPYTVSQPAAVLTAPPGTGWNTPWIWLIVFLPLAGAIPLLFMPWGSMFQWDITSTDPTMGLGPMLALVSSPAYWLALILGWVSMGLGIFFAYRDYRQLLSMGVPKPFHWAWQFLSPVYVFGRSIVVRRRTGAGWAPMWAEIGVLITMMALSVVITMMMLSGMIPMLLNLMTFD